MSELPVGWVDTKFGELVQLQKGRKPTGLGPRSDSRTIAYINIAAFETQVIAEYAPAQDVPVCEPDDTLLVWDGARAGLAGRGASGFIGSTLSRLRSGAVIPGYLYYFISSQFGVLNSQTKGVGIPHVDPVVLAALKFQLPPLAEQTRIVQKLEELLTGLDAGVAELKAAQNKLAQYRQSLLKAAVDGSLTAEWRDQNTPTETGAQLLTRILQERRARWEAKQRAKFEAQGKAPPKDWQKKYPEPVSPDTNDLPELPTGWVWASVDQLSEIQGGIQKQPSRAPVLNKYPFLRVANVARGKLNLDEVHQIELFPGELERLALIQGDVLIVEGNGSLTEIGRCAIWDGSILNAVHQNHLIRVRPIALASQFVETWLNSLGGIDKLTKLAATTSGLYTLSVGKISKIPVPIAPLIEQEAAITELVKGLSALDAQVKWVSHSLKQSAAQRQNILRAAFSGQLVPQDPDDEPASVLLARVRNERANKEKLPKPRRSKQQKENAPVTKKMKEVLADAKGWISAQDAFQRCGIEDGAETDQVEALYAELRDLHKANSLVVEAVTDKQGRKSHDQLKLVEG